MKSAVWISGVHVSFMFFALVLASLMSGCMPKELPVDAAAREGILLVANDSEPEDLDPHVITGFTEWRIALALFEGLCALDPKTLEPVPAVAQSWDVSPDGKKYLFRIRDDAKWSNGDPVTAQDFVYSWQRALEPDLACEYANMLRCIVNAQAYNSGEITDFSQVGVKAIDATHLEVMLVNPTPHFLSMQVHFAFFPVHRPTIESFGAYTKRTTKWTRAGNMVGNGPFVLEQREPNRLISVRRNVHYWDKANVALNGIDFFPITNEQTKERKFRSGEIHVATEVPLSKVEIYKREDPDSILTHPTFGTYFYRLNVTRPPFDDVLVRRAFAMSVDRESLCSNVLRGGQEPASCFTPRGAAGYTCESGIDFSPDAARQMLADAGYPGGAGLPPIELSYDSKSKNKMIAEAIQQMWKANLGVDVALHNQEWKVHLSAMSSLDYQISRSSWYGDYYDPMSFLECFMSDSGNNRTGWESPEYDATLVKAARETDLDKRHGLYQKAEKLLLDDAVIIPIHFYVREVLLSHHVKGWPRNMLSYVPYKSLRLEMAQ